LSIHLVTKKASQYDRNL